MQEFLVQALQPRAITYSVAIYAAAVTLVDCQSRPFGWFYSLIMFRDLLNQKILITILLLVQFCLSIHNSLNYGSLNKKLKIKMVVLAVLVLVEIWQMVQT